MAFLIGLLGNVTTNDGSVGSDLGGFDNTAASVLVEVKFFLFLDNPQDTVIKVLIKFSRVVEGRAAG